MHRSKPLHLALSLAVLLAGLSWLAPPTPAAGQPTVGPTCLLRPCHPVGPLTLAVPSGSQLFVSTRLKDSTVHVATLSGNADGQAVLDLSDVELPPDAVSGDLVIEAKDETGEPVFAHEPAINNVEPDEGVVAELPASGGEAIASSGFGDVVRAPACMTTEVVSRPDMVGVVEEPMNLDFITFLTISGCQPVPGDCPAPPVVGAIESSSSEATPVVADPVYAHNGEFIRGERDFRIDGRGPGLELIRTYRSRVHGQSSVGNNWALNWEKSFAQLTDGRYVYHNGYGRVDHYDAAGWPETPGFYSRRVDLSGGGHALVQADGAQVEFDAQGQLSRLVDRSGLALAFERNAVGQLIRVRDANGRALVLRYRADGMLEEVEDWTGRIVRYRYYGAGELGGSERDLKAVTATTQNTYPQGPTTVYTYAYDHSDPVQRHNLISVTEAAAVAASNLDLDLPLTSSGLDLLRDTATVLNTYDDTDRVRSQRYEHGSYAISYAAGATTVTDRLGVSSTFELSGALLTAVSRPTANGVIARSEYEHAHLALGFVETTATTFPSGREAHAGYDRSNPDPLRRGDRLEIRWVGVGGEVSTTRRKYDAEGRLLALTDPRGLVSGANPDDYTTHFVYGAGGQHELSQLPPVSHFDAQGNVVGVSQLSSTYLYGSEGQLLEERHPGGALTTYSYAADGVLSGVSLSAGGQTLAHAIDHDTLGRAIELIEPSGAVTTAVYDPYNRLLQTVDPLGVTTAFVYDVAGRLVQERREYLVPDGQGGWVPGTPNWIVVDYGYDAFGYLTEVRSGDPAAPAIGELHYDAAGQLTETVTPGGTVTRTTFGPRGMPLSRTRAHGTPLASTTQWTYDIDGLETAIIDPAGNPVRVTRDGLARATGYLDPLGNRIETTPDAGSQVVSARYLDVDGQVLRDLRRTFDERGRIVLEQDLEGGTTQLHEFDPVTQRETRWSLHGAQGLLRETTRGYDAFSRLSWSEDGAGNRMERGYDAAGRLTSVQRISAGGLTLVSRFEYDLLGRLIGERQESADGSLVAERRVHFDSLHRPVFDIDPNGNLRAREYDLHGRVTADVAYLFDGVTMTPVRTEYAYHPDGWLLSLTDAQGNQTAFEYDELGNIRRTIGPGGVVQHETSYDARALPVAVTDASGNQVVNTYDALGRLTYRSIQRGPGVGGATFEAFGYDALGRLVSAENDFGDLELGYDPLGRVVSEDQAGETLTRSYDPTGAVASLNFAGRALEFSRDAIGRLTGIQEQGQTLAEFTWFSPGRVASRTHQNGTRALYDYDGLGRLAELRHEGLMGAVHAAYAYSYDAGGRRLSETETVSQQQDLFGYDTLNRLRSAELGRDAQTGAGGTALQLELDLLGNWEELTLGGVSTPYQSNALNQLTQAGPETLDYDVAGNLRADADASYVFDYANRLVRAEQQVPGGTQVVELEYDAFRRPLRRRVTPPGGTAQVTRFVHDGRRLVAELGDSPSETVTYVYGTGLDELVSFQRNGQDYTLHPKALWSVAHATDANGNLVESYRYDPFGQREVFDAGGQPLAQSAIGNPRGFTGARRDEVTGLVHMRSRHYDPGLGRFISRDGIGFLDGPNLYLYAQGSPASLFDPMGTSTQDEGIDWGAVASGVADGFSENFAGGIIDTIKTGWDLIKNSGDYWDGLKEVFDMLGDPEGRDAVWGAVKEAVAEVFADAWDAVQDLLNALESQSEELIGKAVGKLLAVFANKFVGGGAAGMIADLFANIAKKVKALGKNKGQKPGSCPGKDGECFLAGTLVLTPAGAKPIEEVRPGDEVLSRDERSGRVAFKRVLQVFPGRTREVCRLTLAPAGTERPARRGRGERHRVGEPGAEAEDPEEREPRGRQTLRCTPGHDVYRVDDGLWRDARDLAAGDRVLASDGSLLQVISVEVQAEEARTWNFEVEGFHTYFVAGHAQGPGVWVHNDGCPPGNNQARMAENEFAEGDGVQVRSTPDPDARNQEAIERGNLAHQVLQERMREKGWKVDRADTALVDPDTGIAYYPDAITPSGHPVEIKPDTPSGRQDGAAQLARYEYLSGRTGRVVYYDPDDLAGLLGGN